MRRARLLVLTLCSCLAAFAWAATAVAAPVQRSVKAVDPPSVMQGDTVALTITGENLPTGGVVVEFFPQQIAVLKVLSASDREVVAQIKVPSLAPPGQYNIIIYNQLGDEAFGQSLLTIGSGLITPIFRDFDPKVIAEASSGFALMITGDSITPAVIDHLSMQWYLGEQRLPLLKSSFGMGGSGTVVCAVSGKPPAGVLRGRLFMDEKPIYLVDIKVQGAELAIIGHAPSQLPVSQPAYEVRLLGANLNEAQVSTLTATLESAYTVSKALSLTLTDPASLQAAFGAPLPLGEYVLVVRQGEAVLYSGQVNVVQDASPASGTLSQPSAQATAADTQLSNPDTPAQAATGSSNNNTATARITGASPAVIPAGSAPCRIVCQGIGLSPELVERLIATLVIGDAAANLLFVGAKNDSLTCVFAAPGIAWVTGQSGQLAISDPLGQLEPFSVTVAIGTSTSGLISSTPPQPSSTTVPPAVTDPTTADGTASNDPQAATRQFTWEAQSAYISAVQGTPTLAITIDAPQFSWDPALLKGSFSLLPDDTAVKAAFSNLALEGTLSFRRSDAGSPIGEFAGNFVPGELLVKLSYAQGPQEISVLSLDCPSPKATFIAPVVDKLQRDPASGGLLPETLRFVVDFAPLVVVEPSFLLPLCTPQVNLAQACHFQANGTQAELVLLTSAWSAVRDWGEGLVVELDSKVDLSWAAEPRLVLSVDAASLLPAVTVSLAQQPALIDDKGFVITVMPSAGTVPVAEWSQVSAHSALRLLDVNLAQFQVIATSAELLDQQCIRLRFRRNAETLSDIAYELLRDELLATGEVQISLEWGALNCRAEGTVAFQLATQGSLDDLLEELQDSAS